jgi:hypothetical protein
VDAIIEEAMRRGEFDDLPGAGKAIDLRAYFDTPEDLRLAYTIMKNAGILPPEVDLLKQIAALRAELGSCSEQAKIDELRRAIRSRQLNLMVMLEGRRKTPKR